MTVEGLDAAVAVGALPLLRSFNEAGAISAADVHVAQRLGRLGGESDERVLLAAALAVRGVRAGSVCVELTEAADWTGADEAIEPSSDLPWPPIEEWMAACLASPLVAVGLDGDPRRPLRWVDGRLYLDRYWRQERVVRAEMDSRVARAADGVDGEALAAALERIFPSASSDRQRLAGAASALRSVTVLTGGPGTGKTTTVAKLLAVLHAAHAGPLRVALAAPTGKAAARLQEAVRLEAAGLPAEDAARVGQPAASTLHRLLGWKPGSSTRFRHDRSNHLPHDVVVVDETSMVSLTLMSRLLEALRPQARLVLVGDPDQLASVEAGAVLGDLVARPPVTGVVPAALVALVRGDMPTSAPDLSALANGVVRLERVFRHGAVIGGLAEAVREGRADDVLVALRAGGSEIEFVEVADEVTDGAVAGVRADAVGAGTALRASALAGDARGALEALERHRLLVAHRRGPAGVIRWTQEVEHWLAEAEVGAADEGEWYRGRPLLVTANDRDTGLYNGDTGVVVDDLRGGVVAAFGAPEKPLLVRPHRLPAVQTVHAMTVHRGQGSQFSRVSLVLPPATSPLLTRELLYTAVTRARQVVRVVGSEDAIRVAVERPVRRASGLRHPLPGA
ncbi:MAG TPA: exodeoxyribonuclease V subunit alpha [Actinomycetales bacterium]|nr:exodeoxyribonuclease V subunit alpha [Actinomycetales bacterium]